MRVNKEAGGVRELWMKVSREVEGLREQLGVAERETSRLQQLQLSTDKRNTSLTQRMRGEMCNIYIYIKDLKT